MHTYREATERDLAAICELGLEVNALHYSQFPNIFAGPGAPERDASFWRSSIGKEDAVVLVAELGETVVGFVSVTVATETHTLLKPMRYGRVGSVAISESHRGKGIGKKLMSLAHDWVAQRGGTEVRLNVWKFNVKALGLYEELGYEVRSYNLAKSLRSGA